MNRDKYGVPLTEYFERKLRDIEEAEARMSRLLKAVATLESDEQEAFIKEAIRSGYISIDQAAKAFGPRFEV